MSGIETYIDEDADPIEVWTYEKAEAFLVDHPRPWVQGNYYFGYMFEASNCVLSANNKVIWPSELISLTNALLAELESIDKKFETGEYIAS